MAKEAFFEFKRSASGSFDEMKDSWLRSGKEKIQAIKDKGQEL
jgi:hypothetical protein